MYTILENARIVLALLKKHNIRHIVLSPGGSNIPIVQGVQQDPFFKCYSVVDERSAMYFAIGLYLQTGEIIATSCTSAQATRNYIPGLTEAFYKKVPILAITMSKHPRYLGQEYMQCPIQTSLPVDAVKKSYSLPRISNEHDRYLCVRTANEAMLELTHHGNGPVQLNIEELDSETWVLDETIKILPDIRKISRYNYWDSIDSDELKNKRVMLLIGEHIQFSESEHDAIDKFAESYNVFIYTDYTSNYSGKYAINANPMMQNISQELFSEKFCPDILITIGGLTGDYCIYYKLFNSPEKSFEHWRVALDGDVVDTYGNLTRVYEMRPEDFFGKTVCTQCCEKHTYFKTWYDGIILTKYDMELPLSNLYAAIKLSELIPDNSCMNFAILNSLRVWSWVNIKSKVKAFSNVAAFGIDGCMSTAIGESVETDDLCFLITGDLAFFYDMNSLGIRHIKNNLRILLCNNNGGMEFKFGGLKNTDIGSYVAADNHFKNAEGWAKTNEFDYYSVNTKEAFDNIVNTFVAPSERPILIEIFTTPENERTAQGIFNSSNWYGGSFKDKIKREVKGAVSDVFGDKGVQFVKKIIKK